MRTHTETERCKNPRVHFEDFYPHGLNSNWDTELAADVEDEIVLLTIRQSAPGTGHTMRVLFSTEQFSRLVNGLGDLRPAPKPTRLRELLNVNGVGR